MDFNRDYATGFLRARLKRFISFAKYGKRWYYTSGVVIFIRLVQIFVEEKGGTIEAD